MSDTSESGTGSSIVPYMGGKLERFSSSQLMKLEDLKLHLPRFYLSGNVYVGRFNQAGFVIVDRTPRGKGGWGGSDYISGEWTQKDFEDFLIPEERRPYYIADLAVLRFFAVSRQLMEIFNRDQYLGMPMIRKICKQNIVPEEFDEQEIFPEDKGPNLDYTPFLEQGQELPTLVDIILRPLAERTGTTFRHFPFVVYCQTQVFSYVAQTLEDSVQEAVFRFDEFGKRVILPSHPDLKMNPALPGE